MNEVRVGQGFDVHPFAPEGSTRPLVLGGVTFAGERGLAGHSDADVVAHALGDAILGAAGLGDLGVHFPDTDPAWAGADSLAILAACRDLAAAVGYTVTNGDCTVVCERPKLAPARAAMVEHLSVAAGGPVSVKATRPEGLGSLGRLEGIACFASVLLGR